MRCSLVLWRLPRLRFPQHPTGLCRVLVGGLKPSRVYWYRFTDSEVPWQPYRQDNYSAGAGRRQTGSFCFCELPECELGGTERLPQNNFRGQGAPEAKRIGFVLHLGDFIYKIVWYPEDPHGEKIRDFHIPTTEEDYRAVYRAYLSDPDLQDARARWPFVNMLDNHEFSWLGWQSLKRFEGKNLSAQTRKVAANQAFFEYQPARITKPSGPSLDRFDPPQVVDAPVTRFDEHGLGQEPNNLAAIGSLKSYRTLRCGPADHPS
jgi:alkaline phosphatase D